MPFTVTSYLCLLRQGLSWDLEFALCFTPTGWIASPMGPPFLMSPTLSLEESWFLCGCWKMSLGLNVYVADLFEMYTCIYMS